MRRWNPHLQIKIDIIAPFKISMNKLKPDLCCRLAIGDDVP